MSNFSCLKKPKILYLSKIIFAVLFIIFFFESQIQKANLEINDRLVTRNLDKINMNIIGLILAIYGSFAIFAIILAINYCVYGRDKIYLPDLYTFLYLIYFAYSIYFIKFLFYLLMMIINLLLFVFTA